MPNPKSDREVWASHTVLSQQTSGKKAWQGLKDSVPQHEAHLSQKSGSLLVRRCTKNALFVVAEIHCPKVLHRLSRVADGLGNGEAERRQVKCGRTELASVAWATLQNEGIGQIQLASWRMIESR